MFEHYSFLCQCLAASFPRGTNGEEESFVVAVVIIKCLC